MGALPTENMMNHHFNIIEDNPIIHKNEIAFIK